MLKLHCPVLFLNVYEGCNFKLMNEIYKNFDEI